MEREYEEAKVAIGNNIIHNKFDIKTPILVVTEASGDRFRHILLQNKRGKVRRPRKRIPLDPTTPQSNWNNLYCLTTTPD